MDVISYRGPGAAGGVSSGLGNVWRQQQNAKTHWWFLADETMSVLSNSNQNAKPAFISLLDDSLIKGHYRYCNEFLWPLLHDLPQYATYRQADRTHYRRLNAIFAQQINYNREGSNSQFVQDYQLALVPALMPESQCLVFWHIPWPKNVPGEHIEAMSEIARGILASEVVGFHTDEFVKNFLNFCEQNLEEFQVNHARNTVASHSPSPALLETATSHDSPYILRPYGQVSRPKHTQTKVVAKPLGIDVDHWNRTAEETPISSVVYKLPEGILNKRFVLSVDRADYTKAVADRIGAIDKFFSARPDLRGEISFMQVCGRSRAGLDAFDNYWTQCREMFKQVNDRWSSEGWQPIHWLDQPMSANELASVYAHSDVMLVNPVRDGLNLTAKEYTASQGTDPGVLLLSPGAGAWDELGNYCLPAAPTDAKQIVSSLSTALAMSPAERRNRNTLAKRTLHKNSLEKWWRYFQRAGNFSAREVEFIHSEASSDLERASA